MVFKSSDQITLPRVILMKSNPSKLQPSNLQHIELSLLAVLLLANHGQQPIKVLGNGGESSQRIKCLFNKSKSRASEIQCSIKIDLVVQKFMLYLKSKNICVDRSLQLSKTTHGTPSSAQKHSWEPASRLFLLGTITFQLQVSRLRESTPSTPRLTRIFCREVTPVIKNFSLKLPTEVSRRTQDCQQIRCRSSNVRLKPIMI